MNTKVPQKISYVVVIHAGSYKNYEKELKKKFPTIVQKFSKRVGIHYYIEQLENESEPKISLKDLYTLPIMGIREELSTYAEIYSILLPFMFITPELFPVEVSKPAAPHVCAK